MDDKKMPQEEYSFMQEVIKDETDSPKKITGRIFQVIGYGVILGVIASVTFCAFHPWVEDHMQSNPTQVEIPKDEEEPSAKEDAAEKNDKIGKDEYRQMIKDLNKTASEAKKSMVQISLFGNTDGKAVAPKDKRAGVIVANNGKELLILAQKMKVKSADTLNITFSDGKTANGTVKKTDENLGFSVYAVSRDQIEKTTWSAIEVISMGSSANLEEQEVLIVMGSPFGSDEAYGYGSFTSKERKAALADGDYGLIYTDIFVNTSGSGAILNQSGKLVGLVDGTVLLDKNTPVVCGYGISDLKDIIEILSNNGSVPYVGIYGMDVTEELSKNGMPKGIYVKEIEADSPAMSAGIQSGDVIVAVGEEPIESFAEYHNILMEAKEGEAVVLKGMRKGAGDQAVNLEFKVTVTAKKKG